MLNKDNKKGFKVDFIGIGAPRSGTTWLSRCLEEHPEICMSRPKETFFFNKPYNRKRGISYYKSFFKHCSEGQVRGEFTPLYIRKESIARDIHEKFPDTKLIFCLRNPVERAFSHYLYDKKKGLGKWNDFNEVIEDYKNLYIDCGFYNEELQFYLKYFNREQILVFFHKEMLNNPTEVLKKLYEFLEVDSKFKPSVLYKKINTTKDTNYKYMFINRIVNFRKKMKKYFLGRILIEILKGVGVNYVVKKILRWNHSGEKTAAPNEEIKEPERRKLIKIYTKDSKKLEKN